MRFPFISEGAMPCTNCLSNDALFKVQSDVIRRLAAEKSCVFVGRCADYILREHPRCANVFISATKEDRIARLCQMHRIDEEAAEEMIEKRIRDVRSIIITTVIKHGEQRLLIICVLIPLLWGLRRRCGLWKSLWLKTTDWNVIEKENKIPIIIKPAKFFLNLVGFIY